MLLMLEDDGERLERFAAVLRALAPDLPFRVLISLDHDLESKPGHTDPGDGYMVAQWLTSQPVVRPVIVHSSNGERSLWMAGEFDLGGWRHYRVAPLGDDWVEVDWRRLVRRLLKRAQRVHRSK